MACNDTNRVCPEFDVNGCSNWEVGRGSDSCYVNNLTDEILNIGGAYLNVHKLLGVYEQGKLIDLANNGMPVSSGFNLPFSPTNAFNSNTSEWRSFQQGSAVTTSAYIGYDFGEIRLPNGRLKYSDDTAITKHVTMIKITQGANAQNRITKARVERSDDGILWVGSAMITLQDTPNASIIEFKQSAAARFWRIRPLSFNGGTTDKWIVNALELQDFKSTDVNTLQNSYVFLEQREREYAKEPILIKGMYSPSASDTMVSGFGIDMSQQRFVFQVHFDAVVALLGRPILIGDILEVPTEAFVNAKLENILKYLEITSVMWSANGVTDGWLFTMVEIVAVPALASQETQDIFGDLAGDVDSAGTLNIDTSKYQDMSEVSENIKKQAASNVPVRGADLNNVVELPPEYIEEQKLKTGINLAKLTPNPHQVYVEDGLPPNGESYTSGADFPLTPTGGDYHRITYDDISTEISARLYRWSDVKARWVFMETDKRKKYNNTKPSLSNKINSSGRTPARKI